MDHWSTQPAIGSGFRHCRWGRTGAGRIGEWTRGSGGELRGLGEVGEGRGRGEADCGGWRGKAVDCAKSGEGPEAGRDPSGRCSGAFQNGSPEECGVTGKSPSRSGRGCGRDDDGWSVWGGRPARRHALEAGSCGFGFRWTRPVPVTRRATCRQVETGAAQRGRQWGGGHWRATPRAEEARRDGRQPLRSG